MTFLLDTQYCCERWTRRLCLVGYGISFARQSYKPQPFRAREETRADIVALDAVTAVLLPEILGQPVHD